MPQFVFLCLVTAFSAFAATALAQQPTASTHRAPVPDATAGMVGKIEVTA